MDNESWEVFNTFFDVNNVFVVATMGRHSFGLEHDTDKVLVDPRIKVVTLSPIERWCLGALACQILDVYAISPELEKYNRYMIYENVLFKQIDL